ncbi:MAG: hypothetical protein MUF42_05385 [Cytophagaceae bacterium]|jgi:hypothetical protein|nr:hypothetical protein [Cytophagaceae bacterium]
MQEAETLDINAPLAPGLDFFHLRALGIKHLQELSGSLWTDYNEHDPGVTMLEQLCYAITDLNYRTDFDIKDHFHPKGEKSQVFLRPSDLFPCNPVTADDYRKLFIDRIFELKNVWVVPLPTQESSIKGLYKVQLQLHELNPTEEFKKEVIEKVQDVFCSHRSLCEDIEHIELLQTLPAELHASIEVDGIQKIEEILARIYYLVEEYFNPEIRFYSMQEMLDEGKKLEDIFQGPQLRHGFIKNEDLQPKPTRILISEVVKIIMQIPGVVSVRNLSLQVDGKNFDNQVEFRKDQLLKLSFDFEKKQDATVKFFRGTVPYSTIDYYLSKRKYNELRSASKRVYRLNEENHPIPSGELMPVEDFISVQNLFPIVYGIGDEGLPTSVPVARKAQAKQLKGYLLIFEQIIANHLSQLAHARELFSLNKNLDQSYYFQTLDAVPDVKPLLKSGEDGYYQLLPELVKKHDNFLDRRNRFLDYLLAMHGEAYLKYSLGQFNFYFKQEEYERYQILYKTKLLRALGFLNRYRSKAYNYKEKALDTDNITGIEARIALLLGLGLIDESDEQKAHYVMHSLLGVFHKHGLKLVRSEDTSLEKITWEEEALVSLSEEDLLSFDYIDEQDIIGSDSDHKDLVSQTLPFKSGLLTDELLRNGIVLEKFRVGEWQNTWTAIVEHGNEWYQIGQFDSEQETLHAVSGMIAEMKQLNIASEGLHVVEHLLMRPHLNDQSFGIFLLDKNGVPVLRSKNVFTHSNRLQVIRELQEFLPKNEYYSVEATSDKDFEIHFKTGDERFDFISLEADPSVEITHSRMESLFRYMADKDRSVSYQEKIGFYVRFAGETIIIPEDFFSFRISMVLPTWTARFRNEEFRAIVEEVIRENHPANVAPNLLWLDSDKMAAFEAQYFEWMELRRQEELQPLTVRTASAQLAAFLYNESKRTK